MTLHRRAFLHLAVAASLPASTRIATAQPYPSRAITLVVPYGAGGASDTIARILAEGLRRQVNQPIVVENVAGASGTIGVGRVARAAPDGYTLVLGGWAPHVLNGAMFNLHYDVVRDFEPAAVVTSEPLLIVARKTFPANDFMQFIAWLKANPEAATQGTTGAGGMSTVTGLILQRETGTKFKFVPYRGGLGPAMLDLRAGQIDFMIDFATNSVPQLKGGFIKAYAVTSQKRLAALPDVPTTIEIGMPALTVTSWNALFFPKNTPKNIVAKFNGAVQAALTDPTVGRQFSAIEQEIPPREQQTSDGLAALQRAEIERWWPIIKAANIKEQ
jgi:tripartite-type tricarboxylate transporter receptor subunit TctC